MVRVAVLDTPLKLAATVEVVFTLTAEVLIENAAEVLPAAIVAVPGAVAEDPLAVRVITRPPAGAAEPIVTAPVHGLPPFTVDGLRVSDFNIGGSTVSEPDCDELPSFASRLTGVSVATANVLIVKSALSAPAEIFTVLGSTAAL